MIERLAVYYTASVLYHRIKYKWSRPHMTHTVLYSKYCKDNSIKEKGGRNGNVSCILW